MGRLRLVIEMMAAVMLVVQDFSSRRVSLIWALLFIYALWPSAFCATPVVIFGSVLMLIAAIFRMIACLDVIVCICLMMENTLFSWGHLASASGVLCLIYRNDAGPVPLVGAIAGVYVVMVALQMFSVHMWLFL